VSETLNKENNLLVFEFYIVSTPVWFQAPTTSYQRPVWKTYNGFYTSL